jgi:hypothetical protein
MLTFKNVVTLIDTEEIVMEENKHQHDVQVMRKSLEDQGVVSRQELKTKMNRANSPISGRFQIFRICRSNDIIFILDDPRCEDLDLKPVSLGGIAGKFNGRIRRVGMVEGTIRSDAPIYRICEEALAIKRVTGGSVRFKK